MKKYYALLPYSLITLFAIQTPLSAAELTRAVLLQPMFHHNDIVKRWQREHPEFENKRHHAWIQAEPAAIVVYGRAKPYNQDEYKKALEVTVPTLPTVLRQLIIQYIGNLTFVLSNKKQMQELPVFYLHDLAYADANSLEEISVKKHTSLVREGYPISQELALGRETQAIDFVVSSDRIRSAVVYSDGTARTWLTKTPLQRALKKKQNIRLAPKEPSNGFTTVQFSPCSSCIILGAVDGSVSILEADTGDILYSLQTDACVTALQFSPDGTRLFAGLRNGWVHIWEGGPLDISHDSSKKDGPSSAAISDDHESPVQIISKFHNHSNNDEPGCCTQFFSLCCWPCRACCTCKDVDCNYDDDDGCGCNCDD